MCIACKQNAGCCGISAESLAPKYQEVLQNLSAAAATKDGWRCGQSCGTSHRCSSASLDLAVMPEFPLPVQAQHPRQSTIIHCPGTSKIHAKSRGNKLYDKHCGTLGATECYGAGATPSIALREGAGRVNGSWSLTGGGWVDKFCA